MPQKKNPDPLELVRGKSGKVVGLLTGWLTSMKGLPLGYNKDLQEDKAIAFEAEDTVIACARTTATVVRTLTLRADVARAAASGLASRHRGGRLSREPRRAVSNRARSHRPHRP